MGAGQACRAQLTLQPLLAMAQVLTTYLAALVGKPTHACSRSMQTSWEPTQYLTVYHSRRFSASKTFRLS